jgi:hypothetical protein
MFIKPDLPERFYRVNGGDIEPIYELPKKAGGMRKPTLADAKKMGLMVSVTTICKIIPAPQLESWKKRIAIEQALTTPRLDDEPLDKFATRVANSLDDASGPAREFGSAIHAQIERELISPGTPCPPELDPFLPNVRLWIQENVRHVYGCECVVGDVMAGFAGRLDLHCQLASGHEAILDFKTSGNMELYPQFAPQLAAYGHCIKEQIWPKLITVLISSKEAGKIEVKTWDDSEHYWQVFQHSFEIWKYANNYYPNEA